MRALGPRGAPGVPAWRPPSRVCVSDGATSTSQFPIRSLARQAHPPTTHTARTELHGAGQLRLEGLQLLTHLREGEVLVVGAAKAAKGGGGQELRQAAAAPRGGQEGVRPRLLRVLAVEAQVAVDAAPDGRADEGLHGGGRQEEGHEELLCLAHACLVGLRGAAAAAAEFERFEAGLRGSGAGCKKDGTPHSKEGLFGRLSSVCVGGCVSAGVGAAGRAQNPGAQGGCRRWRGMAGRRLFSSRETKTFSTAGGGRARNPPRKTGPRAAAGANAVLQG